MSRFGIDAPTLLYLVSAEGRLDPAHRLVAPHGIRSDALTLLLRAVRQGELTEAGAIDRHEALTGVAIRILGDRVSRRTAFRIALERGWNDLHHAEHLAVVRLQADALVTVDPLLAAAADGVVPVLPVSALAPS